jgi:WD domain, G-beta repeat
VAFGGTRYEKSSIYVWNFETDSPILHCQGYVNNIKCVVWSPYGNLLASASNDGTIRIWDTQTGKELEQFSCPDAYALRVVWSIDGAFLASSHLNDFFYLWDTRHLSPSQTITTFDPTPTQPLSTQFRLLPTALAQLHQLCIYPPLSLVQDLLNLTGGHPVDNPLAQLAKDTGISQLIALHWSAPARIGLVALLLHKIPFPGWEPPPGISPREISTALQAALKGEPIQPEAPPPPISLLQEAAKLIDEKLLSLLTILGEQAIATEPALPLRLLSRIPDLPVLSTIQRQLLGVRVCFGDYTGRSMGNAPGVERGQVSGVETSSRTDWSSLLPSQLALPQPVLNYRYQRGELLFRTRLLAEPPRLRPTVLLLDVTPPTFGSIESITRIAAFAVANSLREAEIPWRI